MENQIKKMANEKENLIENLKQCQNLIISQKDLINQNNNQINILKQNLSKKEEDNKAVNNELEKIKNEKKDKEKEIDSLREELSNLRKNDISLLAVKNDNLEKKKIIDDFNNLQIEKNNISQQYTLSLEKIKSQEAYIFQITVEKNKLTEKIKQYEEQMPNQQNLINQINNQLNQFKQDNNNINKELEKIRNEKNVLSQLNNEKEK